MRSVGLGRQFRGDSWQLLPHRDFLERAGHSATVVGKHILITGGRNGPTFYNDLIRLDTQLLRWDCGFQKPPFQPRAYHTAVLCGTKVWVIGGSDMGAVLHDVWVLDTITLSWEAVTVRNGHLLHRTAHGCVVHPKQPHVMIIFGGYGPVTATSRRSRTAAIDNEYFNDVLYFDTARMEVQQVRTGGVPPAPRGYHAFVRVGDCCYAVGGRGGTHLPISREQYLACYRVTDSQWLPIGSVQSEGPPPVSSIRGAALEDRIILFGGCDHKKQRFNKVWTLHCGIKLQWSTLDEASTGADRPSERAAHSLSVVDGHLYVISGYGSVKHYAPDAWRLNLKALCSAATENSQQEEAQEAECSQWMRAKRRRKEPVHVAANGQAGHPGGAQDSAALEAPAVQNQPAALAVCQANGALFPVAALPKLQHCSTLSEEERLRHKNEELRKALDHERQMLKGMVNNQELLKERLAAETAQRRLQSELHDLRHATDVEMHALRRQHQIAEDRLQREVLARQAAEQELLHAKRAQESADEAAQKARLYSSELAQKAEEARNESLLHMQSKEVADQELQRLQKEASVLQRTCEHWQKQFQLVDSKRKEAESMAENLQAQLFQARDNADKERTQLVDRAAKAEAALTDITAELERARHSLQSLQTQLTERQAELNRLKEEADGAKKDNADMKANARLAQQWLQMMPAHMKGNLGML
ncbi:probable Kelch repeat-containing protein 2 at N-terminal half [Coccomyxa sp. Obi]|nr:probable Kelch repeat-containing protein 2 at N-terminal half [Coccomyxa sp. Obi]